MDEFPSGQRGQTVNLLRKLRWSESILVHQKVLGKRQGLFSVAVNKTATVDKDEFVVCGKSHFSKEEISYHEQLF